MKGTCLQRRSASGPRRGFTLVELLVVIVIIGMLAGLLIPAIAGAIGRAKEAVVSTELNLLSTALVNFKNKYGEYPPSRILLVESGNYASYMSASMTNDYQFATPSANDISTYQLAQRSLVALRKFWPRMNLSAVTSSSYPDFNGNASQDGPYVLEGDECLAWFLGGVPIKTTTGGSTVVRWAFYGTSTNPTNPFPSPVTAGVPGIMNVARNQLLYDFKSERLKDIDGDGIPVYMDSYTQDHPIIYFSSYGGSYDPNDCNYDIAGNGRKASPYVEQDGPGLVSPPTLRFRVPFPTRGSSTPYYAVSPAPNPYTSTSVNGGAVIWQQPSTYQLISCGRDGLYGVGGVYAPDLTEPLVRESVAGAYNTSDTAIRQREQDNLTNFHGSKLD